MAVNITSKVKHNISNSYHTFWNLSADLGLSLAKLTTQHVFDPHNLTFFAFCSNSVKIWYLAAKYSSVSTPLITGFQAASSESTRIFWSVLLNLESTSLSFYFIFKAFLLINSLLLSSTFLLSSVLSGWMYCLSMQMQTDSFHCIK